MSSHFFKCVFLYKLNDVIMFTTRLTQITSKQQFRFFLNYYYGIIRIYCNNVWKKKVSEKCCLISEVLAPARCGRGAALSFDDAEWGVGNASG